MANYRADRYFESSAQEQAQQDTVHRQHVAQGRAAADARRQADPELQLACGSRPSLSSEAAQRASDAEQGASNRLSWTTAFRNRVRSRTVPRYNLRSVWSLVEQSGWTGAACTALGLVAGLFVFAVLAVEFVSNWTNAARHAWAPIVRACSVTLAVACALISIVAALHGSARADMHPKRWWQLPGLFALLNVVFGSRQNGAVDRAVTGAAYGLLARGLLLCLKYLCVAALGAVIGYCVGWLVGTIVAGIYVVVAAIGSVAVPLLAALAATAIIAGALFWLRSRAIGLILPPTHPRASSAD